MKNLKHKFSNKKSILVLVVAVLVVFLLTNKSAIDFVKAASTDVGGWGWGGTSSADGAYQGIGWLSFGNNADGSIINYGVNVPTSGAITGNAWSENYGWLSFNQSDLTGCPSTTGATVTASSTNPSASDITGWARFLAIKTASSTGNSGGWSGCVSLSSTNMGDAVPYGITKIGNVFSGYAWSDELGWIDFSRVGANKSVDISPSSVTIKQGQSVNMTSQANFGDGSMVGHNMNWKKSGGLWNWELGFVSDGSTMTNSTSVFTNTASHSLSSTFTPAAIGTYNVYSAATSSSLSETLWIDSPVATVNVVFPGCDFFGSLVDTGASVQSYSTSDSPCTAVTSTCQNVGGVGTFVPALSAYKNCSDNGTMATPISVTVSSVNINAGDSVAVIWNIANPRLTCYISATSTTSSLDPLIITDMNNKTLELNKIFGGALPLATFPYSLSLTHPQGYSDINDPYNKTFTPGNKTMKLAVQKDYNNAAYGSGFARGQKTVQLFYPTSFTAHCGGSSTAPDRKVRVNIAHNVEG